jgi:replicative DNA helicase
VTKKNKKSQEMDRMPPYDEAAEKAVISSIFRKNEAIHEVVPVLSPDDFFKNAHRIVYTSILELFEQSNPFDLITVKNQIEHQGELEAIGGVLGLSEIIDDASLVTNVKYYANIVKENSRLRNLIGTAQEILANCYECDQKSTDIIDKAEQKVFDLSDQLAAERTATIEVAVKETFDELSKTFTLGMSGLKTGYDSFDHMTGGLQQGELIIIAGRPAMGKTAFGMNIVQHIASNQGAAALIFSLEMVRSQVALRMLSSETKIDVQRLRKGEIHSEEWNQIASACQRIGSLPIFIDDTPDLSVLEMKSIARRLSKKNSIGLVLVDYIQLVRGEGRPETRQIEISQISRSLKFLAKDLKCPVIALSQLSRAVENRPQGKRRPMLSDLRESGAIEQDADLVVMLYRPEYYEETEVIIDDRPVNAKGLAEIIIAKQRSGPVGSFWLGFQDAFTQFINMDSHMAIPSDIKGSYDSSMEAEGF